MKNVPRIFINHKINSGDRIRPDDAVYHYLRHVMRSDKCLCFHDGDEFAAHTENDEIVIDEKTQHVDPAGNIKLYFAPIKKLDDMLNMATQMGVAELHPVITERTVAHHVNWERMKKIIIEAAEQSGRNSVPKLFEPIKFSELDLSGIVFADERNTYQDKPRNEIPSGADSVLVGAEGGFSDSEFDALDSAGVVGISLGKTILRAEVAAVVAIEKMKK